jgi:hypothetical protein
MSCVFDLVRGKKLSEVIRTPTTISQLKIQPAPLAVVHVKDQNKSGSVIIFKADSLRGPQVCRRVELHQ